MVVEEKRKGREGNKILPLSVLCFYRALVRSRLHQMPLPRLTFASGWREIGCCTILIFRKGLGLRLTVGGLYFIACSEKGNGGKWR